jgi:hypothetical protein
MKVIFLLLVLLVNSVHSSSENDCNCLAVPQIAPIKELSALLEVNERIKTEFKQRPIVLAGHQQVLSFETNFKVPVFGKDLYWGRIFLNDRNPSTISYRDELLAEKHFSEEIQNPLSIWTSGYELSEINSPRGLSLIKVPGSEVNIRSVEAPFTTSNGGRLKLKVKAPRTQEMDLLIDVKRSLNSISRTLLINGTEIPFDSFKVNARSGILGVSILNGVQEIQFFKEGRRVHVIRP